MAQTQSHQLPPRTFSPPVSSPSPVAQSPSAASIAPPLKRQRQRLSPLPQSQLPFNSPHYNTIQLPKTGSPVNGTPMNGMSKPAPNTGAPPPGSMGPPSRPAEKATDAAELTDVLASSGIDIKEEEAFLTGGYGKQQPVQQQAQAQQPISQAPPPPPRIQTTFMPSFGSQPPLGPFSAPATQLPKQPVPLAPSPSQNLPTSAPPIRQPEEIAEDEKLRQDTAASRREQFPLQSSFLQTALIEKKLEKRAVEHGIRVPMAGVFKPFPNRPTGPLEITGPDGSSVIRRDMPLLTTCSALGDIISLISLACEDRLRSVIDHSATLSRNRHMYSHGAVPSDWDNLVKAASDTLPVKEPGADSSLANTSTKEKDKETVANSESTAEKAQSAVFVRQGRRLIDKDETYEESRAAKRAKRSASAITGNGTGGDNIPSTPGVSTPTGQSSERAPDVEKKISKKDAKRADKATGAVAHQHAVETARMQTTSLSSRFGKKGGYSWLKSSQPAMSRSGFSTPSRSTTTPAAAAPSASGAVGKPGQTTSRVLRRRFGDWREDNSHGAGIQTRDIFFTLEVDGRGLRHLQKGYSKDLKEVDSPR